MIEKNTWYYRNKEEQLRRNKEGRLKDPSRGYIKDNIWVISQLANSMKWDSTPEERLAFAKWVLASEEGGSFVDQR